MTGLDTTDTSTQEAPMNPTPVTLTLLGLGEDLDRIDPAELDRDDLVNLHLAAEAARKALTAYLGDTEVELHDRLAALEGKRLVTPDGRVLHAKVRASNTINKRGKEELGATYRATFARQLVDPVDGEQIQAVPVDEKFFALWVANTTKAAADTAGVDLDEYQTTTFRKKVETL